MPQSVDSPSFLIVPVDLDAMCVGKNDSEQRTSLTAPATANFVTLPYIGGPQGPYLGDMFVSKPFQTESIPLKIGVHLHWALPDSLTRGVQTEKDDGSLFIRFPDVPNRWLLTRVLTNEKDPEVPQTSLKSWVIESDFLSTDANSYFDHTNIPMNQNGSFSFSETNPPFRYMGRAIELEKWSESSDPNVERFAPFTAIGYGEPRFASYYPNCRTVFGYQDTFSDIVNFDSENVSISYTVVGWYSDTSKDPIRSSADLAKTLKSYKWELPKGTTVSSFSGMVCAGMLGRVEWNPGRDYIKSDTDLNATQVAVANTNSEGLATLLSEIVRIPGLTREQLERWIEALQIGYLDKLKDVGAMADLERSLHKSFFETSRAETLWTIESADPKTQDSTALSEQTSKDLNQLNLYQFELDRTSSQILSIQKQVFFDWYKFIASLYPSSDNPPSVSSNDIREYIEKNLGDQSPSEQLSNNVNTLTSRIQSLSQKITQDIGKSYVLKSIEAPRFYRPNDPVLLISGTDLQPSRRYGFDGSFSETGGLLCRTNSQTISEFQFVAADKTYSVQSDKIPKYSNLLNLPIGSVPDLILSELYFLDESQWSIPVQAASVPKGAISSIIEQLRKEFDAGSDSFNKNHITGGVLPSPLQFRTWCPPWHPILLQWNFAFRPFQTIQNVSSGVSLQEYQEDLIERNFTLPEGNTDLKYGGEPLGQEQNYSGSTILTPQAIKSLKDRAKDYQKYSSNPTVKSILDQASGVSVLSQALSGFNEALSMQSQEMQFQAHDPLARGLEKTFNQKVRNFVSNSNETSPLPEINFNPIRCGLGRVQKLRVVDSFGQYRDFTIPPTVASRSLSISNPTYPAFLPPRFVQPARLLFRWLSAFDDSEEMNCISSPIHGWLLPNYLDGSIGIYDAEGTSLGTLASYDENGVFFEISPGAGSLVTIRSQDPDFADKLEKTFENYHIREIVSDILRRNSSFLDSFIGTLDRSLQFIEPQNFSETTSTAQLIGRPIAVVRAKLKLELKGNPVQNQSWSSLRYNIDNTDQYDSAKFQNVSFPLRLGSALEYEDGLLGFYLEKDSKTDFSNFYSAHADASDGNILLPSETTIALKSDSEAEPTTVVLLIDPRAAIHATTGVLPKKRIDIPRFHYASALERMSVTFLAAPVLTRADRLEMPYPKIAGTSWSWIRKDAATWQELSPLQKPRTDVNFPGTLVLREGWLKLKISENTKAGNEN
ncbi:hypothetical protein EHO61_08785 [Leptospira fluminis]|uniref:Uncharacterized protein n=1 Tax=Leptospira fluminis TaxID=2484979 RepID=A0A4R9GPM5_9LEPT|nr:hypothetical protein [Leptospira fluminis]TGK18988.1 hypothetical protein EHO61_08785 [Leptospira fluminis]